MRPNFVGLAVFASMRPHGASLPSVCAILKFVGSKSHGQLPVTLRAMPSIIFVLVLASATSTAADPVVGDRVFWKDTAEAKVIDKVVPIESVPYPAKVGAVNGDWLWLEKAWVRKGQVMTADEAISLYTERLRSHPTWSPYWQNRGAIWADKGEDDNAIKDYTEAIRFDASNARAYNNRGKAYHRLTRYDRAIKDFNEAIRLKPDFAGFYTNRGLSWEPLGEMDKAIADYSKAVQLDPADYNAFNNRAVIWSDRGEFEMALSDYNDALKLNPHFGHAFNGRGTVYERMGKIRQAAIEYKTAFRVDPRLNLAASNLAILLAASPDEGDRNGREALDYSRKACELTNYSDQQSLRALAIAYAENGDFANAVQWQEKVVARWNTEANRGILDDFRNRKPFRRKVTTAAM